MWQTPLETDGWFPLSGEEWVALYVLCCRQALVGIASKALESLPDGAQLPDGLLERWQDLAQRIRGKNGIMPRIVSVQSAAWKRRGLNSAVLKGVSVAEFYPDPGLRTSGDIDWFFPTGEEWAKANEAARENGCVLALDSDGDSHYVLSDTVIEHHRRWHDLSSRRNARIAGEASIVEDGFGRLEPLQMLFMLNVHILKHAMVMGVGMRQVCDLAMAYKALEGRYDADELGRLLRKCGLRRWNALLEELILVTLGPDGLPACSAALQPGSRKHPAACRKLLRMVLEDGNLGMYHGPAVSGPSGGILSIAAGLWRHAALFLRFAPAEFLSRVAGLVSGRIKRIIKK